MNKHTHNTWKIVKFGDVVRHIRDTVPDRTKWTFDRYISGEHIDNAEIRITRSSLVEGNEEVIGSAFHTRFKPSHVLYVTRRAYLRKGGMVDFEGVCSNVTFVLEAQKEHLLQSLLPFIIQTEDFVRHATNNSHGSTNPFLNWKDIAKYEFPLPQIEEQKNLSELLWSIENNISHGAILVQDYEHLKKKILIKLLVGQRAQNKNMVALSKVVNITMGQSPPSKSYNSKGNGLPFFQGKGDFGEEYPIVKVYTTAPSRISGKGSILFTVRAPVGEINLCNIRCCIGRGLASIINNKNSNIDYIYYVLQALREEIGKFSQGTTFTAINRKDLENFKIVDIPMKRQHKIVSFIKEIDVAHSNLNNYIASLKALRRKLMNELLNGKMRLK